MVITEMTQPECRAMLARTYVARLACARNNQPYIAPVHVDLDGEFLYGYATLGQRIEWMRQNPLVCLEIDEVVTHRQWASVIVFGRYEELPPTPEYEGLREAAERLFESHPVWWEPASVPLAGYEQRTRIVFRIGIDRMTGRRATPDTVETDDARGNLAVASRPSWLGRVVRRAVAYAPRNRQ